MSNLLLTVKPAGLLEIGPFLFLTMQRYWPLSLSLALEITRVCVITPWNLSDLCEILDPVFEMLAPFLVHLMIKNLGLAATWQNNLTVPPLKTEESCGGVTIVGSIQSNGVSYDWFNINDIACYYIRWGWEVCIEKNFAQGLKCIWTTGHRLWYMHL